MRRREVVRVLAGIATGWPLAARAQQPGRMRRIGVLMPYAASDPETKSRIAAFSQALEQRGWSEDHNLHIEYRYASGSSDQYLPLARELLALQPDLIVAVSTPVAAILQQETGTIPIVFTSVSDPIGAGFVASLSRPGGNFTGVLLYETGIMGKWLAMLKEIAPHLTRAALIGNPKTTPFDYFLRAAELAAPSLGLEPVPTVVENSEAEIKGSIDAFAAAPNGGLVVLPDTTTVVRRDLIVALAAQNRLPAVYPFRLFVDAGGLMAYSIYVVDGYRLAATYVDRILHGAKPAELPVEAPTKYETALNLKTAKTLGLDVPETLLVRADDVIE